MLGRHWTREEQRAYRAAFTVGRIVDELWIIIAFTFFVSGWSVEERFERRAFEIFTVAGFLVLGGACYFVLPKILPLVMPRDLWLSLPRGRFDAPLPATPRTYRELFGRWFFAHPRQRDN